MSVSIQCYVVRFKEFINKVSSSICVLFLNTPRLQGHCSYLRVQGLNVLYCVERKPRWLAMRRIFRQGSAVDLAWTKILAQREQVKCEGRNTAILRKRKDHYFCRLNVDCIYLS